jgi:hypothetical protein
MRRDIDRKALRRLGVQGGIMSWATRKFGGWGVAFALTLVASLVGFAGEGRATPITYQTTSPSCGCGSDTATVTFSVSLSKLIVVLTDTSTTNTHYHNDDVLTGVFFGIKGSSLTLVPVSATLTAGSSYVGTGPSPPHTLGGQWAYQPNSSGYVGDTDVHYGIAGSGYLPGSGSGNFSCGTHCDHLDGAGYGLVGKDYNSATADNGNVNQQPFVKNSITFVLSGIPAGFNPLSSIFDVIFAYGTSPDVTFNAVPEPASLAFFGIGLLSLGAFVRSRRKIVRRSRYNDLQIF